MKQGIAQMKTQPVRGTRDFLPHDMARHRFVIDTARHLAALYNYQEIATPIFEFTQVFSRSIGETSDIVSKEMYTFQARDEGRAQDSITLRPENTAGIVRAIISNGLLQAMPLKYFYAGPMFRYERPQKGRQRQFHQAGVELLGVAEPMGDVETIALARHFLESLGLGGEVTLEINTLGDTATRLRYRDALVAYLEGKKSKLSPDSLLRLERNPLRILDSKDAGDREVIEEAPPFSDYYTAASKDFFQQVKDGLDRLDISYTLNPRLVRGLDYYCHTAFEFTTTRLGAQGTVLAGGRYDGLVELMGGAPTPGVGWACGIERLALMAADLQDQSRPLVVIPVGEGEIPAICYKLAQNLRHHGLHVDMAFSGTLKKRMKLANKANARYALLLGEEEMKEGRASLKDLDSGAQQQIALDGVIEQIHRMLKGHTP